MIRIAICDDEKNIRTYLSSLVRKQNIECEITEYASTDEYLSDQKEHDLLFLDIEMKSVASGMDGMSMAKQIRATELTKQPIIIFVTGYEKYVYDAFDVGAFQYLLKPIDEQRFAQVFRRAAEQIISEAEQQKKTLVIQYANTSKAIPLDHIYYLESQSHKVVIHMNEEELEYYQCYKEGSGKKTITVQGRYYEMELRMIGYGKKPCVGYLIEFIDRTMEMQYSVSLEREVERQTEHIVHIKDMMVLGMADMVESRDTYTGGHIK